MPRGCSYWYLLVNVVAGFHHSVGGTLKGIHATPTMLQVSETTVMLAASSCHVPGKQLTCSAARENLLGESEGTQALLVRGAKRSQHS